jgi:hypothetical protein
MANPAHLLPHRGPQRPITYGQVSRLQPAPLSFNDPLYVVLPDYSVDHAFKIDDWPAIHGATLPALGADVLVLIDDRNNKRVAWWAGTFT